MGMTVRIGADKGGSFQGVGAPDFSRAPKYGSEVLELRLLELRLETLVLLVLLHLVHDLLREDALDIRVLDLFPDKVQGFNHRRRHPHHRYGA